MTKVFKILLFLISLTFRLYAQMESGELRFVTTDSVTHQYEWESFEARMKEKGTEQLIDRSDTVIQIINGQTVTKIINNSTFKDVYERSRDESTYFFNQDYILRQIAEWDGCKLYDLKEMVLTNFTKNSNSYRAVAKFKMYEWGLKGEIIDYKVDKNDTMRIFDVVGYKISYKEKFSTRTRIIKMYVTESIKFPIKLFLTFTHDVKLCPLLIEQFYENEPKNKVTTRLVSVKDLAKSEIDIKVELLKK